MKDFKLLVIVFFILHIRKIGLFLILILISFLLFSCTNQAIEAPQITKNFTPIVCSVDWDSKAIEPSLIMYVYRGKDIDTLQRSEKSFKIQFIKGDYVIFDIKNKGATSTKQCHISVINNQNETLYFGQYNSDAMGADVLIK